MQSLFDLFCVDFLFWNSSDLGSCSCGRVETHFGLGTFSFHRLISRLILLVVEKQKVYSTNVASVVGLLLDIVGEM